MAFIPQNYDDGKLVDLPMTAATYTKGQALTCTSGYYVTAAGSQNGEVFAVCMEGIVIAATGDTAKCILTRGVKFLADCTTAAAQTDVGTVCDLASATTLAQTATTDNLFYIESLVGKTAVTTKVLGYFMHENPNA
jgi:hypothetical protein